MIQYDKNKILYEFTFYIQLIRNDDTKLGGYMIDLKQNVQYVKGVGPSNLPLLQKLDINTLGDLISYYPRGYEDRGKPKKIYELVDGEEALIDVLCVSNVSENKVARNRTILKMAVRDDTGTCVLTWFNQTYLKNKFKVGEKYQFYGKVSVKYGRIEMTNPVFDKEGLNKNTGKIIPIYPLTYKLSQNKLRNIIENGLKKVDGKLEETLPEYILKKYNLDDINVATKQIHFPADFDEYNKARKRLAFEELLAVQLALLSLKSRYDKEVDGIKFDKKVKMSDVINSLPFKLTKAQLKVLEEIDNDMESDKPMNRLLQGDVGSRQDHCINNYSIQGCKMWISICDNGTYCNSSRATYARVHKSIRKVWYKM